MSLQNQSVGRLFSRADLQRLKRYMKEELSRSMEGLSVRGRPPIYYMSYLLRNYQQQRIWGRLGALMEMKVSTKNNIYCDIRVGSHRYDNVISGGLDDNSDHQESLEYIEMPLEVDRDAWRFSLWRLTDACYREAIEQFYRRKSRELHYRTLYSELPSRSQCKSYRSLAYCPFVEVDLDYWKYLIHRAGILLKKYHSIRNSWLEFSAHQKQQLFINSQGSEILQQSGIYELRAYMWLLNKKGEGISQEINLLEGNITDVPPEREFLQLLRSRVDLLLRMQNAPRINSYSGPILLSADTCGIFFHEVIGHRLEGSRLLSADEGATFLDMGNKKVAPDYIDIIDDPTMLLFQGRRMLGSFQFDDEGNRAERTVLLERGVLKNFLSTAAPLPGQEKLNGHARNQLNQRPISRMSNLFVLSRAPVSEEEMYSLFIEEIKRAKKSFGIWVKEAMGGETETDRYDFQAFKGEILHSVRLFPNGKEEIVRGVDFVGTPLSALSSILCLGSKSEVFNGYCGAESGIVPVSTIAPSMLIGNLELQSRDRDRFTPYMLPPPHCD